jgi:hypothetical protein
MGLRLFFVLGGLQFAAGVGALNAQALIRVQVMPLERKGFARARTAAAQ